jgi:hypothetical protein
MAARAITEKRLTAQPCAASKAAKLATQEDRNSGWGVDTMDLIIPVSVPATACAASWPCQKPRPGQAWSTAIPTKKSPMTGPPGRDEASTKIVRAVR